MFDLTRVECQEFSGDLVITNMAQLSKAWKYLNVN